MRGRFRLVRVATHEQIVIGLTEPGRISSERLNHFPDTLTLLAPNAATNASPNAPTPNRLRSSHSQNAGEPQARNSHSVWSGSPCWRATRPVSLALHSFTSARPGLRNPNVSEPLVSQHIEGSEPSVSSNLSHLRASLPPCACLYAATYIAPS